MSFNKVDEALKSVGVSFTDTAGQMRSFTDILIDLGEIWDTLDQNTKRYDLKIA